MMSLKKYGFLFILLCCLYAGFAQITPANNIKPLNIATRILTVDELYLSQGSFIIRTNKSYQYLSVNTATGAPGVGSDVYLTNYNFNDAAQTWKFIPKDGGFFKIQSASGFFLTQKKILLPSLDAETNDDNQLWKLVELPEGFYTIMNKLNKYVIVTDHKYRDGYTVSFQNTVTDQDNQKWQLIKWNNDGRKATRFDPVINGFQFANTFYGVDASFRYGGLCGGMVYSAMDYFRAGKRIPPQTYKPANRTPLQSFIYERQHNAAMENQLDKWTELRMNPFGWRDSEFFEWGLEGNNGGRWQELKQLIDAGNPAPLGLYEGGTTNFAGEKSGDHQVLAVAYFGGRYKGDKGAHRQDIKILIYNPNYPGMVQTLVPDVSRKCFFTVEASQTWRTYFVDRKYSPKAPPDITALAANEPDGSIRHVYATFMTGGDDLRGGSDNVHLTINYTDGTSQTFQNVNGLARWVDNNDETVPLTLNRAISKAMIKNITLTTTFGGGIGGDNWNLDWFVLSNGGNFELVNVNTRSSDPKPLFRFTGDQKVLVIPVH
ncbi:MAG: RICIN domain-containing protein [Bacteroidetes bacterium]|nr:RICIN domain-containing protein [Bacteroidota bacterium]